MPPRPDLYVQRERLIGRFRARCARYDRQSDLMRQLKDATTEALRAELRPPAAPKEPQRFDDDEPYERPLGRLPYRDD